MSTPPPPPPPTSPAGDDGVAAPRAPDLANLTDEWLRRRHAHAQLEEVRAADRVFVNGVEVSEEGREMLLRVLEQLWFGEG